MTQAKKEAHQFVKASLIWLLLMVAMTSFGAFAANAATAKKAGPKKSVAPEIYSATESEEDTPAAKPQPFNPRRELRAAAVQPRASMPRAPMTRPSVTVAVERSGPDASAAFDPVPSDQSPALVKRLRLVELLISRHGRAYDYRVHTVRELESMLAQLDSPGASKRPAPRAAMLPPPPASESPALPAAPSESEETAEVPGA